MTDSRGSSGIFEATAVSFERRAAQMESVIRDWLSDPSIAIVCGDWRSGSTMEILPEGRAVLTPPKYPEPFSGLRDIHLVGQEHHLHLDLHKLSVAVYSVAPCVCYGYRPSFDVRFTDEQGGIQTFGFAFSVRRPYIGKRTNRAALVPYFRRMLDHRARFPEVIRFRVDPGLQGHGGSEGGWREAYGCLLEASGRSAREVSELSEANGSGETAEVAGRVGPEALVRTVERWFGETCNA